MDQPKRLIRPIFAKEVQAHDGPIQQTIACDVSAPPDCRNAFYSTESQSYAAGVLTLRGFLLSTSRAGVG